MNFLGIDNAIAWAQVQLRGGWKSVLTTTGFYVAIVIAAVILTTQFGSGGNPVAAARQFVMWTTILLAAEGAMLVIYISSRISTAIRADITSGILDSHRMMPLSPASAVAGYIWGAAPQGLALAAATFVIGAFASQAAGITLERWIVPTVILVEFAAFMAVLSAFSAFHGQATAGWGVVIGIVLWFGMSAGQAFPGLVLLVTPMLGSSVFGWRTATAEITWPIAASMAAHVILGSIFYIGAQRKYRRGDIPALGVIPALALLAAWVALSAFGIRYWPEFRPTYAREEVTVGPSVHVIAGIVAGMIIACIPLINAARAAVAWRRRLRIDRFAPRRPVPLVAIALLSAGVILLLPLLAPPDELPLAGRIARSAVVLVAHCIVVAFFQLIIFRFTTRSALLAVLALALWVLPFAPDFGRSFIDDERVQLTSAASFSPVGALINIWHNPDVATTQGIAFQASIALLIAIVYLLTRERRPARDEISATA